MIAGTDGNGGAGIKSGGAAVPSADTTVALQLSALGILPGQSYDVWVLGQDDEAVPNQQSAAVRVDVTTGPDLTPPVFSPGFPTGVEVHDFDLSVAVQMDEPGTWFWVLLPTSSAVPGISNVKNGLDGLGQPAIAADSGTIGFAGTTVTGYVGTGILPLTTYVVGSFCGLHSLSAYRGKQCIRYHVYAVAEDDEATPNVQLLPTYVNITTGPDVTPPVLTTGFPATPSAGIEDFAFQLDVQMDEPGLVYYVVVPEDSLRPSVSEATTGKDGTGAVAISVGVIDVPAGGVTYSTRIASGIIAATVFDCWVVGEDIHGNRQLVSSLSQVQTLADRTPPVWDSGFPVVHTIEDFSFSFNVALGEPGVVTWVAVLGGSTEPNAVQVYAGTDGSGGIAVCKGTIPVLTAALPVAAECNTGVLAATAYDIWLVGEDDEPIPNIQATPKRVNLTTGPDVTPPVFQPGYPNTTNVRDFEFSVAIALDEPGRAAWVVLPAGAAPPTVAAVGAGTDGVGGAAIASGSAVYVHENRTAMAVVTTSDAMAASTKYDVWVFVQDDEPVPNVLVPPQKTEVETLVDTTRPVFRSGYPTIVSVGDFQLTATASLDEPGNVHYAVALPSAPAPTASELFNASYAAAVTQGVWSLPAAQVPVPHMVSGGFIAETDFNLWLLASDTPSPGTPNPQLEPVALNFTTGPDVTPPVWTLSSPSATDVADFAFNVRVALDEPGTAWYIVLYAGFAPPTLADVVAGTDGDGVQAIHSGKIDVGAANQDFVATIGGRLKAVTSYDVWFVAADDELVPNQQLSKLLVSVTTMPDVTPPVWRSSTPALESTTDFTVKFDVQLDEPGTVYWVMIPVASGSPAPSTPSPAAVLAGSVPGTGVVRGSGAVHVADTTTTVASYITDGVAASTTYHVWFAAADDEPVPNVQLIASKVEVTTLPDTTPPTWEGTPSMQAVADFTADVHAQLNEPSTVFFMVVPSPTVTPQASHIEAGESAAGDHVAAFGTVDVALGHADFSESIPRAFYAGLRASTSYHVFLFAEDKMPTPNRQSTVINITFTTLADVTAPRAWPGFPRTELSFETEITFGFAADEAAFVYWIMVPATQKLTPTVAQVTAGLNAFNLAPTANGNFTTSGPNANGAANATVGGLPIATFFTVWFVPRDFHGDGNVVTAPIPLATRSLCKFIPEVVISGPASVAIRPSQDLSLIGVATPTGCLDDILHEMEVFWSVASTRAASNVGATFSLTPLEPSFVVAASSGPDPRVLALPAGSLKAGHVYRLVATTRSKAMPQINGSAAVEVEVVADEIVAEIAGGTRLGVAAASPLVVDAVSHSFDRDVSNTDALVFNWTCVQGVAAGADAAPCSLASGGQFNPYDYTTTSPGVLTIPSGVLDVDMGITVRVIVSKGVPGGAVPRNFRSATTNASYTFQSVVNPPVVTVTSKVPAVINAGSEFVINSAVTGGVGTSTVLWTLPSTSTLAKAFTGSLTSATLVVPPGTLRPGRLYTLLATATDGAGVSAAAQVTFRTNARPYGGSVLAAPLFGYAGSTLFTLTASAEWAADISTNVPLQYRFGYRVEDPSLDTTGGAGTVASSYSLSTAATVLVPSAAPTKNLTYSVFVQVKDALGTESERVFDSSNTILLMPLKVYADSVGTTATVPVSDAFSTVQPFVDAAIAAGDPESLYGAVGVSNGMLDASQSLTDAGASLGVDTSTELPCEGVTCGGHGVCRATDGACVCEAGYLGTACETVLSTLTIDGGYTQWSDWTPCTAACGSGQRARHRVCSLPSASGGGLDCVTRGLGASVETETCNTAACPELSAETVHGGWGPWTEWSACSTTCTPGVPVYNPGEQHRTRACDSPAPLLGGLACIGSARQERACNTEYVGCWQWRGSGVPHVVCGGVRVCAESAPALFSAAQGARET